MRFRCRSTVGGLGQGQGLGPRLGLGTVMVLLLAATAIHCSGSASTKQTCSLPASGLPVRLSGHVYGYGHIFAEPDPSASKEALKVRVETLGPDIGMNLSGSGFCTGGVLRAKLAGGRDENAKVRVLGGSFAVFMDHEPMSRVYGVWEVRAQREDTEDPVNGRPFHGLIEAVTESELEGRGKAKHALADHREANEQKADHAAGGNPKHQPDNIQKSP